MKVEVPDALIEALDAARQACDEAVDRDFAGAIHRASLREVSAMRSLCNVVLSAWRVKESKP